jgi:hypothetical protein
LTEKKGYHPTNGMEEEKRSFLIAYARGIAKGY